MQARRAPRILLKPYLNNFISNSSASDFRLQTQSFLESESEELNIDFHLKNFFVERVFIVNLKAKILHRQEEY